MKKEEMELLSDEELEEILENSETHSAEDVACAEELLQKRSEEREREEIRASRRSLRNVEKDIHTIKNCVMFFTVLTICALLFLLTRPTI